LIGNLRKSIPYEEFDYQTLLQALEDYAHPRDKISNLIRKKIIIRVKKGIYIFGEEFRHEPYSREILANLIDGPSYVSLEYALQFYGLIPERVESVTSVTVGRARRFNTPIGLFSYTTVPMNAFASGVNREKTGSGRSFLIALPEKALADKIRTDRRTGIRSQKDMRKYIIEDMRLDWQDLRGMQLTRFMEYAERYRSKKIAILCDLMIRERDRKQG